jgi:hypothetical protein
MGRPSSEVPATTGQLQIEDGDEIQQTSSGGHDGELKLPTVEKSNEDAPPVYSAFSPSMKALIIFMTATASFVSPTVSIFHSLYHTFYL